MNFQTFAAAAVTFTAARAGAAWEAYIQQDAYLSEHRGEYAAARRRVPAAWSTGWTSA